MQEILRHRPGVVSPEAATSFRESASLRSSGFRQEALELALTCDASMPLCGPPWGSLLRSSITTEMARGPRVKEHKLTHAAHLRIVHESGDLAPRSQKARETGERCWEMLQRCDE